MAQEGLLLSVRLHGGFLGVARGAAGTGGLVYLTDAVAGLLWTKSSNLESEHCELGRW